MFQNVVNTQPAPAEAGDFASSNPTASMLAGPGGLVVPAGGLTVGHFAFVNPNTGVVSKNYAAGDLIGFIARRQEGLITIFLAEATYMLQPGFPLTLMTGGDYWVKARDGATPGATVYADENTGAPVFGSATDTVTASAGFAGTASLATVAGQGQMTIASITGTTVVNIGDVLNGTGVTAGTTITGLVSGVANTVGAVYSLSAVPTTEAAEAVTTTSLFLNVTAALTGGLTVGDVLSGTGVTAGTVVTSVPAAGPGTIGLYGISPAQQFASTTVTNVGGNVATNFVVGSLGVAGNVVKISANA